MEKLAILVWRIEIPRPDISPDPLIISLLHHKHRQGRHIITLKLLKIVRINQKKEGKKEKENLRISIKRHAIHAFVGRRDPVYYRNENRNPRVKQRVSVSVLRRERTSRRDCWTRANLAWGKVPFGPYSKRDYPAPTRIGGLPQCNATIKVLVASRCGIRRSIKGSTARRRHRGNHENT